MTDCVYTVYSNTPPNSQPMALSPHRNNTHQQPSKRQQKCGHGPRMVRMKPWVGTKPQIGEDGTSDRDETLGCGDGTPCCNKEVEVECPHDGGWCYDLSGHGVNGIKWVPHPDTICNEARPGRH